MMISPITFGIPYFLDQFDIILIVFVFNDEHKATLWLCEDLASITFSKQSINLGVFIFLSGCSSSSFSIPNCPSSFRQKNTYHSTINNKLVIIRDKECTWSIKCCTNLFDIYFVVLRECNWCIFSNHILKGTNTTFITKINSSWINITEGAIRIDCIFTSRKYFINFVINDFTNSWTVLSVSLIPNSPHALYPIKNIATEDDVIFSKFFFEASTPCKS